MSSVFKIVNNVKFWFECDGCVDCQDSDPDATYHFVDCTRHEFDASLACVLCGFQPCRCDEIRDRKKYGNE